MLYRYYQSVLKDIEVLMYKNMQVKQEFVPKVALVLGSGLGALANEIDVISVVEYNDINNFPTSTIKGHRGRFVFGYINKVPVVIMQGRVHYYEGYTMDEVILPIRMMKLLGAEILMLTNAAGGINSTYDVGDFMIIKDHISMFVPSPLIGANIKEFGPRFPDMSSVYDEELNNIINEKARELDINIKLGVYAQLTGPNYETPSEVKALSLLGADSVGMSTACEAMIAKHMGMKVCGISCITNMASGVSDKPLSHKEVQETADRVAPLFKSLVIKSIELFGVIK